jgi:hypothetical protein
LLQLHQLPFAIRSPIGGTKEQQNRSILPGNRLVGLLMAELVGCLESGRYLAFRDSNLLRCLFCLPWISSAIRLRHVRDNDQQKDNHPNISGLVHFYLPHRRGDIIQKSFEKTGV